MENYDLIFLGKKQSEINTIISDYYSEDEETALAFFPKFNKINIIVGANNSGKSRFMRYFMAQDSYLGILDIKNITKLIDEYNFVARNFNIDIIEKFLDSHKHRSYDYIGNNIIQKKSFFQQNKLEYLKHNDWHNILKTISNNKEKIISLSSYKDSDGNFVKNDFIKEYDLIPDEFLIKYEKLKRYYIPTLRTAHSLFEKSKKIENDIFLETLNKYYSLDKIDVEVFTGIHLHKQILNTRNAKRSIRQSFENFEKFISKNFFEGRQVDIVAEFNKDESLQGLNHSEVISVHIEGERETRYLYDLGDGIQAIIILMYKIFMAENNAIIFIDEPELNLHPGMQRLFLEQIYSNDDLLEKNLKYVISTHSNHFLDISLEKKNLSIYSFSPKTQSGDNKQFIIKNVNSGDNTLLKHLGVNNSSVFMANSSIWVEGISDRNYIKAFLKSYLSYLFKNDSNRFRSIKEDIDYAFFEYAGSNIDHYVFNKINYEDDELVINEIKALSLNNRIFLLADSDLADGRTSKGKRLKKIEDSASDNFVPKIIWEVREIENLLTNDIWEKVLIEFCHKRVVSKHSEVIQEKIKDALNEVDYLKFSKDYIGTFLNEIHIRLDKHDGYKVLNESIYEKKSDGFGTFVHKRELSELVLNADFPWEVFSKNPKIVELTEQVYKFIINES